MTSNELPRKRSWKRLILVLVCAVVVTTIALLAIAPKREPVRVWFVRSTNVKGVKTLVFEGTNGTARAIWYNAYITTDLAASSHPPWPPAVANNTVGYNDTAGGTNIAGGRSFTFNLADPPEQPAWRVVWWFGDYHAIAPWEVRRYRLWLFLRSHGMRALAGRVQRGPLMHYIPSTEIKE
jgi:hypothetical protein